MPNKKLAYLSSVGTRVLCLGLAGLTACSSARPKNVWQDLGPVKPALTKASKAPDAWGASSDDPNGIDPVVAPGFLLVLVSLSDQQLNGNYRVNFDGSVELPYGVTVNTTGMSLSQLKKKLMIQFQPYFKTLPDIDVKAKERRYWVDVRGLVQKPGQYLIDRDTSLDAVITMAGGVDKQTPPQYARIQKGSKTFVVDLNQYYRQGEDHPRILGWLGGEVLFLQKDITGALLEQLPSSPSHLPVYILGEVQKPGEYPYKPGTDFVDTLVQANGFTTQADLDHIEIIRRTAGRESVYAFSWRDFERAPAPIQGDVILVHADRPASLERKVQILALIASILSSGAIVYELNRNGNR